MSELNDYTLHEPLLTPTEPETKFKRGLFPVLLSICYVVASTIMPLFNKKVFSVYDFPVTATLLQVIGATLLLFVLNLVYHFLIASHKTHSWVFGPHFVSKSLLILPVSIFFSITIVLTNIGVSLVPANIHVLLKTTNIIWIVLLAWLLRKEKPGVLVILSMIGLITGTLLVSLNFAATVKAPAIKILVNLVASFSEVIVVVTLKWSMGKLTLLEPSISMMEVTLFKLGQSIVFMVPIMFAIEKLHGLEAIPMFSSYTTLLVVGGVLLTMFFQSTTVGLVGCTFIITVGMVIQIQVLPQTLLSIVLFHNFLVTPETIIGSCLIVISTFLFAFSRWKAYQESNQLSTFTSSKYIVN